MRPSNHAHLAPQGQGTNFFLSSIAAVVLAVATSGCCPDTEGYTYTETVRGELLGEELDQIRAGSETNEARCEAACFHLGLGGDRVTSCTAMAPRREPADPWDPAHASVTIACEIEGTEEAFCTGRRPHGHREAGLAVRSVGAWFAVHAHLERASVRAFEELARWLESAGAPDELSSQCRSAALDEVRHAELMGEWARRHDAEVPVCEVDPSSRDPLTVALLNAAEGCVFESFAAMVATHQAEHAATAELRALFSGIATDELRHGQLAWDLHAWLMSQLSPEQQAAVARARADALAKLEERAVANALATPPGLGWPGPETARAMARCFSRLLLSADALAA